LLGQATRLDRERPLYGPAVGEHLHVNLNAAVGRSRGRRHFAGKGVESVNFEPAILNVCSAFIANTCS
jgi:hypothetical protein